MIPFLLLLSFSSLASGVNDVSNEEYVYSQQGDELIYGRKASITWVFDIHKDGTAIVNISSWHAPFTCNGKYKAVKYNKELNLIWAKDENKDIECDTSSPQFVLKKTADDHYLIKSDLFPWSDGGWEKLKIKK
jgi:hypothetical protein